MSINPRILVIAGSHREYDEWRTRNTKGLPFNSYSYVHHLFAMFGHRDAKVVVTGTANKRLDYDVLMKEAQSRGFKVEVDDSNH